MTTRLTKLILLAALLFGAPTFAAGCQSDDDSQESASSSQSQNQNEDANANDADDEMAEVADEDVVTGGEIAYVTTDDGITGPAAILSGWTTVNFTNEGEKLHHVQLMRLADDKTLDDLGDAMAAGGPPPEWLVMYGGPNVRMAPGPSTNVIDFAPGMYVATSVIPDEEGQSLLTKGEMSVLTVLEEGNGLPEPESNIQMVMGDFVFLPSEPFEAGEYTVRVESAGAQPHEIVLVKLEPGASIEEFAVAIAGEGPPGPPPGAIVAGTTAMAPGQTAFMPTELDPGNYGLVCFIEDPESGEVHADLGMAMEFEVQ